MTHGEVYIPYTNEQGEKYFLHFSTPSDGYFDSLGYALLASSNHMDKISRLMSIFMACFYYDTENNKITARKSDFDDFNYSNALGYESIVDLFFNEGFDAVSQSSFAQIPVEKRVDDTSDNSLISHSDFFSSQFINSKMIDSASEAIQVLEKIASRDEDESLDESIESLISESSTYVYYNDQWFFSIEDYQPNQVVNTFIPAIIIALNYCSSEMGCFTNPFKYINQSPSEKDTKTIKELYQYNIENNVDMSEKGWQYIKEYQEKMILENSVSQSPIEKLNKIKV
jgi:hypothetical protein